MVSPPTRLFPHGDYLFTEPCHSTEKLEGQLNTTNLVKMLLTLHWFHRPHPLTPDRVRIANQSYRSSTNAILKPLTISSFLWISLRSPRPSSVSYTSITPPTTSDQVACFLLHLEDGSFSKDSLSSEFDALDSECKVFLIHHLGIVLREGSSVAEGKIHENPCLLLQLQNRDNDNVLEVLLKRLHQRDSILAELKKLKPDTSLSHFSSLLKASPFFDLFCWFVLSRLDGKDSPGLADSSHIKVRMQENSEILFNKLMRDEIEDYFTCLQLSKYEYFELKREEVERFPKLKHIIYKLAENYSGMTQNIKPFRILFPKNEEFWLDIAIFLANKCPGDTLIYLKDFDLAKKSELFKIAQVCAIQLRVDDIIFAFREICQNEIDLIDLMMALAKVRSLSVAECSRDLSINQEAKFRIAKLCVQQNSIQISRHLYSFKFKSLNTRDVIVILCLMNFVSNAVEIPDNDPFQFHISDIFKELSSIYLPKGLVEGDLLDTNLSNFYPNQDSKEEGLASNNNPILDFLGKERSRCRKVKAEEGSPLIQSLRLDYLMALYLGMENQELDRLQTSGTGDGAGVSAEGSPRVIAVRPETQNALAKILPLRNRPLKAYLTFILSEVTFDPYLRERFCSMQTSEGRSGSGFAYALPILLIAASWSKDRGCSKEGSAESNEVSEAEDSHFKYVKAQIQSAISANREAIKNAGSLLNICCLTAMKALDATCLSGEEKLHLFTQICKASPKKEDAAQFEKSLKYLNFLCEIGRLDIYLPTPLKGNFTFAILEDFAIQKAKTNLFGSDSLSSEDQRLLQEEFLVLAEKQRVPFSLELYACKIRSLNDDKLNEAISRFIKSVLRGSFKKDRYDASLSPHLELIETRFPDLWSQWQSLPPPRNLLPAGEPSSSVLEGAGTASDEASLEPASRNLQRDSYLWLKEKLVTDRHLVPRDKLPPEIASFLDSDEMLESAENLSKSLNAETPNREMYLLCLGLCKIEITLEETKALLHALQKLVSEDSSIWDSQWKWDIDDRIKLLSTQQEKTALQVSITDDWQDIFLCGTEVPGSCQRVDGDGNLNKGLLGYCLDGKIQMAALKDKKSGKIRSRALLKLLLTKEGGKPVLFLERIYPSPCPDDQVKALSSIAIQRAKDLGIDLYTLNLGLCCGDAKVGLESLRCPAPFEYADGGGGLVRNGIYVISAYKVTLPID